MPEQRFENLQKGDILLPHSPAKPIAIFDITCQTRTRVDMRKNIRCETSGNRQSHRAVSAINVLRIYRRAFFAHQVYPIVLTKVDLNIPHLDL